MWKSTLIKDDRDQFDRLPWSKMTLISLKDHPYQRWPWSAWKTTLIRDHPDEKPSQWKTTQLRTTLMKILPFIFSVDKLQIYLNSWGVRWLLKLYKLVSAFDFTLLNSWWSMHWLPIFINCCAACFCCAKFFIKRVLITNMLQIAQCFFAVLNSL